MERRLLVVLYLDNTSHEWSDSLGVTLKGGVMFRGVAVDNPLLLLGGFPNGNTRIDEVPFPLPRRRVASEGSTTFDKVPFPLLLRRGLNT